MAYRCKKESTAEKACSEALKWAKEDFPTGYDFVKRAGHPVKEGNLWLCCYDVIPKEEPPEEPPKKSFLGLETVPSGAAIIMTEADKHVFSDTGQKTYHLFELPPGRYSIKFQIPPYPVLNKTVTLPPETSMMKTYDFPPIEEPPEVPWQGVIDWLGEVGGLWQDGWAAILDGIFEMATGHKPTKEEIITITATVADWWPLANLLSKSFWGVDLTTGLPATHEDVDPEEIFWSIIDVGLIAFGSAIWGKLAPRIGAKFGAPKMMKGMVGAIERNPAKALKAAEQIHPEHFSKSLLFLAERSVELPGKMVTKEGRKLMEMALKAKVPKSVIENIIKKDAAIAVKELTKIGSPMIKKVLAATGFGNLTLKSFIKAYAVLVGYVTFLEWTAKEAGIEVLSFPIWTILDTNPETLELEDLYKARDEHLPMLQESINNARILIENIAWIFPPSKDIWLGYLDGAQVQHDIYYTILTRLIEAKESGLPKVLSDRIFRFERDILDAGDRVKGLLISKLWDQALSAIEDGRNLLGDYELFINENDEALIAAGLYAEKLEWIDSQRDSFDDQQSIAEAGKEKEEEEEIPEPTIGFVDITTEPVEVEVSTAGRVLGKTDTLGKLSLSLEEGTYDLLFRKEGYYDEVKHTIVRAEETAILKVVLNEIYKPPEEPPEEPLVKAYRVTFKAADPQGIALLASVFIDGSHAPGLTPLSVNLRPGSYLIRFEAFGYIPKEVSLELPEW